MKKINKLIILVSFMLFNSCINDDLQNELDKLNNDLIELQQINSLLKLKSIINESYISELLILELKDKPESILLIFENGSSYEISKELVIDYQIDNVNWKLDIALIDLTHVSAYILGNELKVKEIDLNPFNTAPLSAIINIETPISGLFTVKVIGQDGVNSDFTIKSDYYGKDHSLKIFGLYPGYNNKVELIFTNKDGILRTTTTELITTDELPLGLPDFNVVKQYNNFDPNTLFLVNYRPTHIPFMVDPYGKIRWYSVGFTKFPKMGLQRFKNGNIGYGKNSNPGLGEVVEYTLMGELVKQYSFYPEFEIAHHDVYEMSNGNFLILVNKVGIDTIEDHIIELDRNSGTINNIWDLREILPTDRYTLRKIGDGSDWFHANAVIHDESDNTIIVSGQAQGLIKVTWDNQLKWILAPHEGWSNEYVDYLLQPTGSDFEWSWGQHAPLILPNKNILQFDNGFGREFGNSSSDYSRIVEYDISENDNIGGEISQVWQYGKERGEEMISSFISDVDYIENTSTRFIVAGATAFDVVYTDSLNVSFTRNIDQIETRMIEVNLAKEVLFEMTLSSSEHTGSTYRAEKLIIND